MPRWELSSMNVSIIPNLPEVVYLPREFTITGNHQRSNNRSTLMFSQFQCFNVFLVHNERNVLSGYFSFGWDG